MPEGPFVKKRASKSDKTPKAESEIKNDASKMSAKQEADIDQRPSEAPASKKGGVSPLFGGIAITLAILISLGLSGYSLLRSMNSEGQGDFLGASLNHLLDKTYALEDRVTALEALQEDDIVMMDMEGQAMEEGENMRMAMPEGLQDCDIALNADEATETVHYTNTNLGIAFDIPYNPNWGTSNYSWSAYKENEYGADFGPPMRFETCGISHTYAMERAFPESMRDRKADLEDDILIKELGGVTEHVIGDTVYLQYAEGGLCKHIVMEVFGEKNNILFQTQCGTDQEQINVLTDIVKSISFNPSVLVE